MAAKSFDFSSFLPAQCFAPTNLTTIIEAFSTAFFVLSPPKSKPYPIHLICSDLYNLGVKFNNSYLKDQALEAASADTKTIVDNVFWKAFREPWKPFNKHSVKAVDGLVTIAGITRREVSDLRSIPEAKKQILYRTFIGLSDENLLGKSISDLNEQFNMFQLALQYSKDRVKIEPLNSVTAVHLYAANNSTVMSQPSIKPEPGLPHSTILNEPKLGHTSAQSSELEIDEEVEKVIANQKDEIKKLQQDLQIANDHIKELQS